MATQPPPEAPPPPEPGQPTQPPVETPPLPPDIDVPSPGEQPTGPVNPQ